MNYNCFKRHDYYVMWSANKNDDGTYSTIQVVFTRDYSYADGGTIVTDPFEVKYACKTIGFDYDSLQKVFEYYFIKENSIEWNKYLDDPGELTEPDEMNQIKKERTLLSKLRESGVEFTTHRLFGQMCVGCKNEDRKIIEGVYKALGYNETTHDN